MSEAHTKKEKQMPKGGRKGGSVFPRTSLTDALGYARKLVSKTHTGPQSQEVVLSGVLGSKTGAGRIRMSALKQYGLLEGDTKSNFSASDLAKKIASAPSNETISLYQQAMLNPIIFRKLFETYHGDTVSKAKLKQRASDLNVHPDSTSDCVELYVSGMTAAEMVTIDGDQIKHIASSDLNGPIEIKISPENSDASTNRLIENNISNPEDDGENIDIGEPNNGPPVDEAEVHASVPTGLSTPTPRAVFNVNVTLDSSLDIEKLQRQLELLKRYGAI